MNVHNDFQSLAELRPFVAKCPRCSLCKFPPLVRVESAAHSLVCPSYDELKLHASSGGGMIVMGMSLLDGRGEVTEAVRRRVDGCLACGACDVSCKFSSDIEVQEAILQLRRAVFEQAGPRPEAAAVLRCIREEGHPLTGDVAPAGEWLREVGVRAGGRGAALLWVGPHHARAPRHRARLARIFALLQLAGIEHRVLGADEPYAGRAALELGDRRTFEDCARRTADAIRASGAREVVCLSAEDYTALRSDVPRVAKIDVPVVHLVELYERLLRSGALRPNARAAKGVAWHDPCYLGRLSEPWTRWEGRIVKVKGQLVTSEPPRPVRRGAQGCYEPPRAVLRALLGRDPLELPRRREYAYSSGEPGQAPLLAPALAQRTAERRLDEARAAGARTLVTECPQSLALLEDAAGRAAAAVPPNVVSLTDLLYERALGGAR